MNNWYEFKKQFDEIMAYVKELKKVHGEDGKDVVIDDLALRLARQRAGVDESAEYGK